MPIRRNARERLNRGKGRHPSLRIGTENLRIWNYVNRHPGCTSKDIISNCLVNHQRISDLLNEGLLVVTGKKGKYRTYEVVKENVEGISRDKVVVRVTVLKNKYGEYSAKAKVMGQIYGAEEGNPVVVTTKHLTIFVPREDEPVKVMAREGLIIDAKYEIIDHK